MKRYQVKIVGTTLSCTVDSRDEAIELCDGFKCQSLVFDLAATMIVYRNWVDSSSLPINRPVSRML